MNKKIIRLLGQALHGKSNDIELEVVDAGDGRLIVEIPCYIGRKILGQQGMIWCPLEGYMEDSNDMMTAMNPGEGYRAIDKHISKHGRIFESDIETLVNTLIHHILSCLKSTGSCDDSKLDELTELGYAIKQEAIQQAGDAFIGFSDPRYIEFIKEKSKRRCE